ncbi:hypothetical protein BpHYR1_052523 [Brachionus plicatilis]|uniref:Uncharacterized protein n=1 Tax=Brachionus plicatilis TaxID=10195 RepID=A0A3M7QT09_BRAPC|nr:hypothetical protein BpHYR1_052523 [Brachionus plicatilis]
MFNWPLIHFEFAQSYQDNFKNTSENIIEKAIDYIPFIEVSNKLADKFPSKLVYRKLINLLKTFSVETHVQDNVSCRDINMYQNEIKILISNSSKIHVSIHIEKMLKSDVVDFLDTTYYKKEKKIK